MRIFRDVKSCQLESSYWKLETKKYSGVAGFVGALDK